MRQPWRFEAGRALDGGRDILARRRCLKLNPAGPASGAADGPAGPPLATSGRCAALRLLLAGAISGLLSGCMGPMPQPWPGLNRQLDGIGSSHSPALTDRWLALIGGREGREQVVLVDLSRQLPVPLPGLNRPDAQPLTVAVDGSGEKLAVVRQLEGRTELVLYRRSLMALEPVAMQPAGVPRRISLRADGRELAVEVSRGGVWQVDLIALP